MKKRSYKHLSLASGFLLSLSLLVPGYSSSVSAESKALTDIQGHWAQSTIEQWINQGLASGYKDQTFKPNNSITRAEFMTLANKALGYSEKSTQSFGDVSASAWFKDEVSKAHAAGYISGYNDGTIRPQNPVTRQEVAAMIAKMAKLDTSVSLNNIDRFQDDSKTPTWSKNVIQAVVAQGFMKGYPDQTFQPTRSITRAEAIATLQGLVLVKTNTNVTYDEAGTYGPQTGSETVNGDVSVTKAGVTLQNLVVKGDLYLAEGIGEGEVVLQNVTVQGNVLVQGGGANSITLIDSLLENVTVNKKNGAVRLLAKGKTNIENVTLESGAKLEEAELSAGGFTQVTISDKVVAQSVVTLNGTFEVLVLNASNISLDLVKGSVTNFTVNEAAKGSLINLAEQTNVANLTIKAPVKVTGKGSIDKANIEVNGVTVEQQPGTLNLAEAITAFIAGVEAKATQAQVPAGGGGGGGGGAPGSGVVEQVTPSATFSVPGASSDDGTHFDVSKTTKIEYLNLNLNTESEVEIVDVLRKDGTTSILDLIRIYRPELKETMPAGSERINLLEMFGLTGFDGGVAAGNFAPFVDGTMIIKVKLTNTKDASKVTEYTVKVNIVN
ncbi:S-layer homology domain-containing protein [Ammoniphilus sp. CFH 90114]|uniref:S-layer homology domain-containing protein n=1 Tax=Ammoniphilus sp. CFH 90114 TaxID=2493665 RepID=UPI0013E95B84|nr:S-layer homology domain-containing protein [Ammoniphilus sp. CFH 90114]